MTTRNVAHKAMDAFSTSGQCHRESSPCHCHHSVSVSILAVLRRHCDEPHARDRRRTHAHGLLPAVADPSGEATARSERRPCPSVKHSSPIPYPLPTCSRWHCWGKKKAALLLAVSNGKTPLQMTVALWAVGCGLCRRVTPASSRLLRSPYLDLVELEASSSSSSST